MRNVETARARRRNAARSCFLALGIVVSILGGAFAAAAAPAPQERIEVNELVVRSLAVSPDGRFIAFERRPRGASRGEFVIYDVESRNTLRVARDSGGFMRSRRPLWSPDGRRLAFFSFERGDARLVVWDAIARRQIARSREIPCRSTLCDYWSPKWLADNRHILFVAEDAHARPETSSDSEDANQSDGRRRQLDELIGIAPSQDGVTVLRSAVLGMPADTGRPATPALAPTKVVSFDVDTGRAQVVAANAPFIGILVAGESAVAVAQDAAPEAREYRFSFYRIPLTPAFSAQPAPTAADGEGRDGAGRPLPLLARRVPNWQAGRSVSLSPSGRLLAYVTSGPAATGDLFVVDLITGRQSNVTAEFAPGPNPLDVHSTNDPRTRRADWHGKFGTGYTAPIWSEDERAVYVVRAAERPESELKMRFDLWRIPLSGGEPHKIGASPDISITRVVQCPALEGPCPVHENEIIARIRQHGRGVDEAAFAAIDVQSGAVRVLAPLGAAGLPLHADEHEWSTSARDLVSTTLSSHAIGVSETPDAPPELWMIDSGDGEQARALALMNPGPAPEVGRMTRVTWTSPDGERLGGLLQLPVGARVGERPPIVIEVYGGGYLSRDGGRFGGGERRFDRLRAEGRFAILSIDLPPPRTMNGPNCDYMAANAVAALDAASRTGWVDAANAGIVGVSWGGYSVNCIITRTDRFKAAASIVGLSNLVSTGAASRGGLAALANITATPWEAPELYVSETPLFHLNRVNTPLLIVYGKRDLVPLNHQLDMFYGLNALNKPVELVGYDRSGHGEMFEFPDFWQRLRDWFNKHLRR